MLVIVGLITVEIVLRTLLKTSTLVADEYSGYLMVAVVFFGMAWTLRTDGHIRIGLLTSRLPEGWQKALDLLAHLFVLAFCLYFLMHTGLMVEDTRALDMRADSIAETPLWIPQLSMLAGLVLLTLQVCAEILRRLLSSPTR
ncbi:MAG: TRAP transporter small permease [Gammaproteobacteria bacterium]|nr:MAG: TRAP transporter small permease [Gammaproteobacteria bacterium]